MNGSRWIETTGGLRICISTYSDEDFDDFAKILYPKWIHDKDLSDDKIIAYFKDRHIDLFQDAYFDDNVVSKIKELCSRIEHNKPLLVQEKKEENEVKIISKRKWKKKFALMSLAFVVCYIVSCTMSDLYEKSEVLVRLFLWFFWAFFEIILLTSYGEKSKKSKLFKAYSVISFLSVPLLAFLFVFLFHAWSDRDFLHLTMILFAPLGYIFTWCAYLIHALLQDYFGSES